MITRKIISRLEEIELPLWIFGIWFYFPFGNKMETHSLHAAVCGTWDASMGPRPNLGYVQVWSRIRFGPLLYETRMYFGQRLKQLPSFASLGDRWVISNAAASKCWRSEIASSALDAGGRVAWGIGLLLPPVGLFSHFWRPKITKPCNRIKLYAKKGNVTIE